ncbi:uncharacterized protein RJT21DRAFT_136810 [Scheffersomyces amazonensis]|uniref:uncharacterized protein n=1 Tax=Scheffersomyces amazonensis TaxID=1078765 RepID=UPI00315CD7A5
MGEYFKGILKKLWGSDSDRETTKSHVSVKSSREESFKRRIVITLISFLVLSKITIFNYWLSSSFTLKFPQVDIVNLLRGSEQLPTKNFSSYTNTTYEFSNTFLIELLKDVYLRNEEEYLGSVIHTSIIVVPSLEITPSQISLVLREGFCNFWTSSKFFSNLIVTSKVTNDFRDKVGFIRTILPISNKSTDEIQFFVRKFLFTLFYYTDIPESKYSIDSFSNLVYLLKLGNFGIFVSSIFYLLLLVPLFFIENKYILPLSAFAVSFCTVGFIFTLFNFIVHICIQFNHVNLTSWISFGLYLLEAFAFLLLALVTWNEFMSLQNLNSESLLDTIKEVDGSAGSTFSSVYSNPPPPSLLPTPSQRKISVNSVNNSINLKESSAKYSINKSPSVSPDAPTTIVNTLPNESMAQLLLSGGQISQMSAVGSCDVLETNNQESSTDSGVAVLSFPTTELQGFSRSREGSFLFQASNLNS